MGNPFLFADRFSGAVVPPHHGSPPFNRGDLYYNNKTAKTKNARVRLSGAGIS
jgi:hypothetical protein